MSRKFDSTNLILFIAFGCMFVFLYFTIYVGCIKDGAKADLYNKLCHPKYKIYNTDFVEIDVDLKNCKIIYK